MKIALLGAGAMGSLYASYLVRSRHEVTLFDHHADKVALINKYGMTMLEDGLKKAFRVRTALSGSGRAPVDVIGIFVKAYQTADALESNQALIGENTLVFTLQNGMGNYLEIEKYVPLERIVIGTSNHNSTILAPGRFLHAASGKTILGGFFADQTPVEKICSLFDGTGLDVSTTVDVKRLIWRKLLVNMSINPITMLLERPNGVISSDEQAWAAAERVIDEGVAVALADGVAFEREAIIDLIRKISFLTGEGFSSMLQDRKKKRRTEIDYINGAAVRLGKKYGIPTPANEQLVALVHALENAYL